MNRHDITQNYAVIYIYISYLSQDYNIFLITEGL